MPKKRLFCKQIKINLTKEAHSRIKLLASDANLTVSEFVRILLDEKTVDAPLPQEDKPKIIYRKVDPQLLYEINKIGININQIAKRLNGENILELEYLVDIQNKIDLMMRSKQ